MIFTAMAIGAGIGALAGFAVYGAKVLLSKKRKWSWKDAGAHALGGLVGGAAFPPVLAGLAAIGVPTAVGYVAAGGVAWGGIWSLAQDAASWAFGRSKGLRSPKHYLINTAIGMAATALLLPCATRAIGPAGQFARHSGTLNAYLSPSSKNLAANMLKSEAEFLAYGAITETVSVGARMVIAEGGRSTIRAGVSASARAGAAGVSASARTSAPQAATELFSVNPLPPLSPPPLVEECTETETQPAHVTPCYENYASRIRTVSEERGPSLSGLIDVLEPAHTK